MKPTRWVEFCHHITRLIWFVRNLRRPCGEHYVYVDGCECSSCKSEYARMEEDDPHIEPSPGWEGWYAWRPVRTDLPRRFIDGHKVRWLCRVWRFKVELPWSKRTQWVYVSDFPQEFM